MKKLFSLLCTLVFCFLLTGCGSSEKNIEGSLNDIMDKLYEGIEIENDEEPILIDRTELTSENIEDYTSTNNIKYKEALASENAMGASKNLHIVVLIRLEDVKEVDKVVEDLKKNNTTDDWVCGAPQHIYVLSKGDLVVLIMGNDLAPKIKENFENLR